jgi:gliding motility-associated lipoprotein GldH
MTIAVHKYKFLFLRLIAVLLVVAGSSCDRGRLFDDNTAIPSSHWEKEFRPAFKVEVSDTTTNYGFYFNVRNTDEYRYSNLFIFLETQFPNGNVTRDTIECMLADLSGRWLGRGSGNLIEHQILLNPVLRFPLSGHYTFEIEQAMREPLKGITDVGIRIEKSR